MKQLKHWELSLPPAIQTPLAVKANRDSRRGGADGKRTGFCLLGLCQYWWQLGDLMRRWDSSWDYMKGRGATGGEEKGEISVFDLDPEQGLHLSEGRGEEGGRQENRRGRGRADSSCERFCRLNTNSTIVLHKLITGKQNADLYTNVRDYYFPAVSYFPHLDYFLSYWKAATDKSQSPAANPPDHTPTTDHKTSLSPVLRSETTERKKTEQSRKMSERRPSRTRQRSSGMSAMFFLPPTPFLLHLSSSLLLHLLPLSTLVWTQLSSFLSNVTPMIRARRSRHSENSS